MQLKDFRGWARRELGDDGECTVRAEVTDKQLDQALDNAKDWFNSHVGLHKEAQLNIASDQTEYDLSSVTPRVDQVVNVWMPDLIQLLDFRGLYPGFLDVQGFPYGSLGVFEGHYPNTTLTQTLQGIESSQRTFSADKDWEFYYDNIDPDNPKRLLRIMPAPSDSGIAYYLYRVDPRDIKLEMYPQRDLYLIREWALADAKQKLGRIRGKYTSGLPSAGGDRTLDGEILLSEAREDKDRLEQKMIDYDGPIMPIIG